MTDENQINQVLMAHGYEYVGPIGTGSSCNVFLCKSEKYHQTFAIKCLSNATLNTSEYTALTSLNHPYIIKLYEAFEDHNSQYLVMEYCPNETLMQKKKLPFEKFIYYAKQVLEALSYCHSNKIAHRDIKPDNIFLDHYDRIKLADFGLSKQFQLNNVTNEKCGSLMYCSPEMLNKLPFDPFQADIWALGITFFYMATGKFPFPTKSYDELLQIVKFGYIDFLNVDIQPDVKALIQRMTNKIPKLRPTVDEILKMPIFDQLKALQIKKTLSSGQFCSRSKSFRNKGFIRRQRSASFSEEFEINNNSNNSNNEESSSCLALSRSKAYKSSITHSSIFKMNPSFESNLTPIIE